MALYLVSLSGTLSLVGAAYLKIPARFAELLNRLFTWRHYGASRGAVWFQAGQGRSATFPQDGSDRSTRWTFVSRKPPKSVV